MWCGECGAVVYVTSLKLYMSFIFEYAAHQNAIDKGTKMRKERRAQAQTQRAASWFSLVDCNILYGKKNNARQTFVVYPHSPLRWSKNGGLHIIY